MDCDVEKCDTNAAAVLREVIRDRFRRDEIAGVTTTSDFYVAAIAELAEWLGIASNSRTTVETCRNKSALRDRLRPAGVRQPRYAALTDASESHVAGAVDAVELPCVAKPVDGSGSANVLLCRTVEEAAAQVGRILSVQTNVRGQPAARTALVEEYLDGPEVSVEMFGWAASRTASASPTRL